MASPNLTNESAFILKEFASKVLKTENIFMPLEENPIEIFYTQLHKHIGINNYTRPFESISDSNVIFLVNTDIQLTHPILLIELNKAKKQGAKIVSINLSKYDLPLETEKLVDYELNLSRKQILTFLLAFSKQYIKSFEIDETSITNYKEFIPWLESIDINEDENDFNHIITDINSYLQKKDEIRGTIIFGLLKTLSGDFIHDVLNSLFNIMVLSGTRFKILPLWRYGNCEGVYQNIFYDNTIKLKPTSQILKEIGEGKIKALYLTERLNNRVLLDKLELVILQDIYSSDDISFANYILPSCSFIEESGSYINSESILQKLNKSANTKGSSKADWKIISELAQNFQLEMDAIFTFDSLDELSKEISERNSILREFNQQDSAQKLSNAPKSLFTLNLNQDYERPYYDVFTQKSFQFRGEPIYTKVSDFKNLIEYRTEKAQTIEADQKIEIESQTAPFKIIQNNEIAPNFFKLTIEAPYIAQKARPSSFIIIMENEKSERIPLTLSNWDKAQGTITVIYQESGFSTRELTEKKRGEHLYSVVGPLGCEIELKNFGTVLLGGGCYGIGAIYPIAKKLKELGNRVIIILEARNKHLLYYEKEFENLTDEIIYCTSDGSKGLKGKIETGIEYILKKRIKIERCHFIGCNIMMMNAANTTQSHGNIPSFVNLNTIMIDGTGMCGGCRVRLIEDGERITKFACVDGPTFNGHLVDWENLISRGNRFDFTESQVFQTHTCLALEKENNRSEQNE
jgi:NAD(P)H-flavin reductase